MLLVCLVALFGCLASLQAIVSDANVCGFSLRKQWRDAETLSYNALIKSKPDLSPKDLDEQHQLFQDLSDSTVILFNAKAEARAKNASISEVCPSPELLKISIRWSMDIIVPWIEAKGVDINAYNVNHQTEFSRYMKKLRKIRE